MRFYVGVTDRDWYELLASNKELEEANFWRPSPNSSFNVLQPGELFLFKLHAPHNVIVGGGQFARFVRLPISLAWDAFGEANGVHTLAEMRKRIGKYRSTPIGAFEDPQIGCILLEEPFFFTEDAYIAVPGSFKLNTVQGKSYGFDTEDGRVLYEAVSDRLLAGALMYASHARHIAEASARYGTPVLVPPRLGQGSFRVLVGEAYGRRCSMTGERTLPVLEAAHIRPYAQGGAHRLDNGLFLRSDLHTLFDRGFITVNPDDYHVVVSPQIREEYENGRAYYALHGQPIALPTDASSRPATENLLFHAEHVFHG